LGERGAGPPSRSDVRYSKGIRKGLHGGALALEDDERKKNYW